MIPGDEDTDRLRVITSRAVGARHTETARLLRSQHSSAVRCCSFSEVNVVGEWERGYRIDLLRAAEMKDLSISSWNNRCQKKRKLQKEERKIDNRKEKKRESRAWTDGVVSSASDSHLPKR